MLHESSSHAPGLSGSARSSEAVRQPWPHYWPAGALAVAGLVITAASGWQMDRWARARDAERFVAEGSLIVKMIEQKMERYESMLGRLSDAFARENGEVSSKNWSGWLTQTLGMSYHYPNLLCVVVAPKVTADQRAAFEQRAATQVTSHPGVIQTSRSQAGSWFPVWQRSPKEGFIEPGMGDDLLAETAERPSFEPALGATVGWVAERPSRLVSSAGVSQVGFWFVLPLKPMEFERRIQWQWPDESGEQAARRRDEQRARQATGLLAAFIGGDLFLNDFNGTNAKVRVQLFTSETVVSPATLLNPGQPLPARPRHTQLALIRCYGRKWTARLASTPVFEAGSLQYRAWLAWSVGTVLTLVAAGAVAWQTRGRWREAMLAAQLREALARQERLSRDLHDGTLQSVYGVGLALQRAQRLLENRPVEAVRQITETTGALQGVIGELRDFIRQTDPLAREEVSLSAALAGVVADQRLGTEMELQLEIQPEADRRLTPPQSLQLLNIAREALSNSIRHSRGRTVRFWLGQSTNVLRLEVVDDGCGFDVQAAQREGRGLANLATRVRELGGKHRWETAPNAGTRLVVEVPLPLCAKGVD